MQVSFNYHSTVRDKTEILWNKQKDLISSTSAKAVTISTKGFGSEAGDLSGHRVLAEWQGSGLPPREQEAQPQAWDFQNFTQLRRSRV